MIGVLEESTRRYLILNKRPRENVEEKRVGMGTTFALKYKVLG